jgi:hypothetical protein
MMCLYLVALTLTMQFLTTSFATIKKDPFWDLLTIGTQMGQIFFSLSICFLKLNHVKEISVSGHTLGGTQTEILLGPSYQIQF